MHNNLLDQGKEMLSKGDWKGARNILEAALEEEASAEVYEEMARACWWLNDINAVWNSAQKLTSYSLTKTIDMARHVAPVGWA